MGMFDRLYTALNGVHDIPFALYGWNTRPNTDYGVLQIDFAVNPLNGDDLKQEQAFEGSIDLFLHTNDAEKKQAVENAIASVCGASWKLNSIQYEESLIHYEWVFQIESE